MKLITKTEMKGMDPEAKLRAIARNVEIKVINAIRLGIQDVKRHLVYMTAAKLTRRSGALNRDISAANTEVISTGSVVTGRITVSGMSQNKRGTYVSQYLSTLFGKGSKVITSKGKLMAVPIQGGPANAFTSRFSTIATGAPKDFPGIKVRIGQVLMAGERGKSRDLYPTWVLLPRVTINRRVDPQDAVDEAQMEILERMRGLIASINE